MDNRIINEVKQAPAESGVYIMKDDEGRIIYVGKAKHLKNRLKSYFSGEKDIKTVTLLRHVRNIETIIVANEYEALLLENTLIKQHSPKYNINLKDGKTYPVIRITHEDFARVFRTRRIIQDGSLYFGPFPNVPSIDIMLDLIDRLFPLRKCRKIRKNGPCMYYHISRCMAPCCGKINIEEYNIHVQRVQKVLAGETESLFIDLASKMHEAARALQYEKAAQFRNTIKAIENLTKEERSVQDLNPEDRDYIAWTAEGVLATFVVFSMRGGKMTGRDLFRTRSAADELESLEIFITSYYDTSRPPPQKIFIQNMFTDSNNLLSDWFKAKFNFEPELLTPEEKHHEAIMAMARQNAAEDLRKRLKERGAGPALDELAQVLNLKNRPENIEGFDISHLDGKHPVASLISFKNGVPNRKNYRHFKLRTVIGIVDDFAAMREVVSRRYSRIIREGLELPDLILVDGGIGQVNAAKEILTELGVDCGLIGLAERNEEIWLADAKEPIVLSKQSEALKVLQFVRDECHRFAVNFNRKLRSKDLFFPILESVEGIGPKRAAAIMKTYNTIANIAAADVSEMSEHCKISEASARAVRACAKLHLKDRQS
ncbi:MAG: excinuclease ABC subunit UvrC [Treponema sp.]|jgi:excinuclease ABC subunit C|nr:excinuclease ABC subunit UvrC [Treponema sp.]